jgi:SAM-dependent methyltransferase
MTAIEPPALPAPLATATMHDAPAEEPLLFEYEGVTYPSYLKRGNACSYIEPFARQFCRGKGLDIGGYKNWVFPGARAVNITLGDGFEAYCLPDGLNDYIFSSHTLEHLPDYVRALEIWRTCLRADGVLFLYLPHPEMKYWNPQFNRKHLHLFYPEHIREVLESLDYRDILISGRDLFWSFAVVAFRP